MSVNHSDNFRFRQFRFYYAVLCPLLDMTAFVFIFHCCDFQGLGKHYINYLDHKKYGLLKSNLSRIFVVV